MFTITDQWLMDNRTDGGGWTREQLAVLGVSWPPKSGWKDRVIGTQIPYETAELFCVAAHKKEFDKKRYTDRRAEFAAMAMQGILANSTLQVFGSSGQPPGPLEEYVAQRSVQMADALIKELEK